MKKFKHFQSFFAISVSAIVMGFLFGACGKEASMDEPQQLQPLVQPQTDEEPEVDLTSGTNMWLMDWSMGGAGVIILTINWDEGILSSKVCETLEGGEYAYPGDYIFKDGEEIHFRYDSETGRMYYQEPDDVWVGWEIRFVDENHMHLDNLKQTILDFETDPMLHYDFRRM